MPEQPPPPRKRGRPPNPQAAKRRNNVTIRMSDDLKAKLQEMAESEGRSLSEAIELRLEGSFRAAQHITDVLGGPDVRRTAMLMAATFANAGARYAAMNGHPEWTAKEWTLDPDCYREAMAAVAGALLRDFPSDDPEVQLRLLDSLHGRLVSQIVNKQKRDMGNG